MIIYIICAGMRDANTAGVPPALSEANNRLATRCVDYHKFSWPTQRVLL